MARILIAEHNPETVKYLTAALKKTGNSIETVDNCLDAWRAFSKSSFDILLIDVAMPGIDGFVLAQKALQDNPSLQIVFITGFAGVAMDTYATPVYAPAPITTHPFHLKDIASCIRYLLGQGGMPMKTAPSGTGDNVFYADFSRKVDIQQQALY